MLVMLLVDCRDQRQKKKQIPRGNDRKKSKNKGKNKRRSRFPEGMTEERQEQGQRRRVRLLKHAGAEWHLTVGRL